MRNGNFLKMGVSEIHVKQIRVNQGLGVLLLNGWPCTKPIGNGCTYQSINIYFFVGSNKKVNVIYFKNSSRVPWLDSLKNSDWKTICNSFSIIFLLNPWLEKLKQLRTYFNLLQFMFCTFQLLCRNFCERKPNLILLLNLKKSSQLKPQTAQIGDCTHTAWIWIWMMKRRGTTSDNGFMF